jgi:Domain of unknown function (DUF4034)
VSAKNFKLSVMMVAGLCATVSVVAHDDLLTVAPASSPSIEREFIDTVRTQLKEKRFDQLDATMEELSRTKARFPGGDWKLHRFFGAMEGPLGPEGNENESDETWQRHLALLRSWQAARPKSLTAPIALGQALLGFAWQARGTGYSNTVSETRARLFDERLEQAEAVLFDADAASANVHWYAVVLRLGMAQGWSRATVEEGFKRGVAVEPLYLYLYGTMALYLMPRWYGEAGDWERFADESTTRIGGREGSALYGHIAVHISQMYGAQAFFTENRVSWSRLKQGLLDREQLYGVTSRMLNTFCRLAGGAADRPTTRDLLARIGDAWDPDVWKERKYFDEYRTWAMP